MSLPGFVYFNLITLKLENSSQWAICLWNSYVSVLNCLQTVTNNISLKSNSYSNPQSSLQWNIGSYYLLQNFCVLSDWKNDLSLGIILSKLVTEISKPWPCLKLDPSRSCFLFPFQRHPLLKKVRWRLQPCSESSNEGNKGAELQQLPTSSWLFWPHPLSHGISLLLLLFKVFLYSFFIKPF